jgi:hypothetical protein
LYLDSQRLLLNNCLLQLLKMPFYK